MTISSCVHGCARRLAQGDAGVLDRLDPDEKRRIQEEAERLQAQGEAHGSGTDGRDSGSGGDTT